MWYNIVVPEVKNMKKLRIIAIILLVATAVMIFLLTSQNPEQTTSLTQYAIEKLPEILIQPRDSNGNIIVTARRMAHIYQFMLMGIFSAFIMSTFKRPNIIFRGIISVIICAIYSLGDQFHKLFVVGRHFDSLDLKFDFIGYFPAAILTIILLEVIYHICRIKKS
jgi:VanZ family protein